MTWCHEDLPHALSSGAPWYIEGGGTEWSAALLDNQHTAQGPAGPSRHGRRQEEAQPLLEAQAAAQEALNLKVSKEFAGVCWRTVTGWENS